MNKARLKFRIPMFTDKGTFTEFQYLELGDEIETTLCGYNGDPQFCTGIKIKKKFLYEGDIVHDPYLNENFIIKYDEDNLGFVFANDANTYGSEQFEELTILGNPYENPDIHLGDCEAGENGKYKAWEYT